MTTATATLVDRTGPAILAALQEYAPQERAHFGTELREALTRAGTDLDVARVDEAMARWHTGQNGTLSRVNMMQSIAGR